VSRLTTKLTGLLDLQLAVGLGSRQKLQYEAAESTVDRPPIVRAVSGLVMYNSHWYLIQDDASFVAIAPVNPSADMLNATSIVLPPSADGRRQFSQQLHNKHHKLDLESCFVNGARGEPILYSVGSGSTKARTMVLELPLVSRHPRLLDAAELYDQIASALGHLPNLEGATVVGDMLWLFHRGNTGPSDIGPAAFGFSWRQTIDFLDGIATAPTIAHRVALDLGQVSGVRYGITDVVRFSDFRIGFLAAAEASANAIDDGAVVGALLGVIHLQGDQFVNMKMAQISEQSDGALAKFEGLFVSPDNPTIAYAVADPDNTEIAAEIVTLHLQGPWWD
jgi:hypothetical protein